MKATAVTMNAQGRLTVPAEARRELGLGGEAHFEAEIRDGELLLRPAVLVPREDAWAYTPEHLALLARARADAAHGRTRRLDGGALRELTVGSDER
jgi:bifunctional DNA-binding transcriptional regulator/antitoxin component of YhaV-PrlF toxin-antitoxin module